MEPQNKNRSKRLVNPVRVDPRSAPAIAKIQDGARLEIGQMAPEEIGRGAIGDRDDGDRADGDRLPDVHPEQGQDGNQDDPAADPLQGADKTGDDCREKDRPKWHEAIIPSPHGRPPVRYRQPLKVANERPQEERQRRRIARNVAVRIWRSKKLKTHRGTQNSGSMLVL